MIAGVHALLYAYDAEAARAFFRDMLGLECVDAGEGWLIFAAPPCELAFHPTTGEPGPGPGRIELYLMCADLAAMRRELEGKGVGFVVPATDEGWGIVTRIAVPGYGELGLYQPRHPSPLQAFS